MFLMIYFFCSFYSVIFKVIFEALLSKHINISSHNFHFYILSTSLSQTPPTSLVCLQVERCRHPWGAHSRSHAMLRSQEKGVRWYKLMVIIGNRSKIKVCRKYFDWNTKSIFTKIFGICNIGCDRRMRYTGVQGTCS